jgi:hypothetical protein
MSAIFEGERNIRKNLCALLKKRFVENEGFRVSKFDSLNSPFSAVRITPLATSTPRPTSLNFKKDLCNLFTMHPSRSQQVENYIHMNFKIYEDLFNHLIRVESDNKTLLASFQDLTLKPRMKRQFPTTNEPKKLTT